MKWEIAFLISCTKQPHLATFVVLLFGNQENYTFNKTPTSKSANPDLIVQCIEEKKRHNSAGVKIVQSARINKPTDYRSFA